MAENIMEKLANRARVRVYKPFPGSDDRSSLEGELLQKENVGTPEERHFFEVGAHRADYINGAFRKYTVSEPFIPGVDNPDEVANLEKKPFACDYPGCDKSFGREQDLKAHKKVAGH